MTSGNPVSDVRINGNILVHNGTGFGTDAGQCFSTPSAPGDCGETIHLVSVTDSKVEANDVVGNIGGILLTDEFGPTSGNVVRGNPTLENTDDCGVTLAGHNPAAVNPATGLPTGAAGVFDNLVEHNVSNDNGVAGQGAGILLGGGAPDAGVYDNVIRGNVARGNGLAGVTIHQHLVGDLNGNVITHNRLSDDNIDFDFDFAAASATQLTGSSSPPGPRPDPRWLRPWYPDRSPARLFAATGSSASRSESGRSTPTRRAPRSPTTFSDRRSQPRSAPTERRRGTVIGGLGGPVVIGRSPAAAGHRPP